MLSTSATTLLTVLRVEKKKKKRSDSVLISFARSEISMRAKRRNLKPHLKYLSIKFIMSIGIENTRIQNHLPGLLGW